MSEAPPGRPLINFLSCEGLALAEVRPTNCEVVIYRNDAADLQLQLTDAMKHAVTQSDNLVVTGTALISEPSRTTTLELMLHAKRHHCHVWLDLDYRPWNWPDLQTTRAIYSLAAEHAHVVVGNEEEFAVLTDELDLYIKQASLAAKGQTILLKRGGHGASLFTGGLLDYDCICDFEICGYVCSSARCQVWRTTSMEGGVRMS